MSASTLFAVSNLIVLPAWVLLILIPGWKWTRVVAAYVTPMMLGLIWAAVMAYRFAPSGGGFGSLDQLELMLNDRWLLVAGWLHNLMLDVFLGAWEVRDAQRLGVPHGYVIPCLAVTFLAGPIGLLAYFAVRVAVVKRFPWTNEGPSGPRSLHDR